MKIQLLILLFCISLGAHADGFFRRDTVCVKGTITGFQGKTARLYIPNDVTGEPTSQLIEFSPDGRFNVVFILDYPVRCHIEMAESEVPLYLIPGDTLNLEIQWSATNILEEVTFSGQSARINQELTEARKIKFESQNRYEIDSDDSIRMVYHQQFRKAYQNYKSELLALFREKCFLPETQKLLLDEALLYQAFKLLDYDQQVILSTPNDNFTDPDFDPYYDFLQEIPWNDPTLLSILSFSEFIRLFDYSVITLKKWKLQKTPDLFFKTLEKAHCLLTPEAQTLKACKDSWELPEKQETWKNLENYYSDSLFYGIAQQMLYQHVVFQEGMKLEKGLFWDLLKVRLLKNTLNNTPDRISALEKRDFIMAEVQNPFLLQKANQLIERKFPVKASPPEALKLPEGAAKEFFARLIHPYQGKVILMDVWAVWCSPCIDGIEHMQPIRERFADQEVAFLFVTSEKNFPIEAYNQIMKSVKGYKYRLNEDEYNYLGQLFQITFIPRYILIDRSGQVVNQKFETFDLNEVTKTLENLLK